MPTVSQPTLRSRHGAPFPRPHVSSVARALAKRLGISPKSAQHRLEQARETLTLLPDTCREIGRTDWLRLWSAPYDISRAVGTGIEFSLSNLRYVAAADSKEGMALVDLLTAPDSLPELEAYERALAKELSLKMEALAMVREEIARRKREGQKQ